MVASSYIPGTWLLTSSGATPLTCPLGEVACPGGPSCNNGYTSYLCAICEGRSFLDNMMRTCRRCNDGDMTYKFLGSLLSSIFFPILLYCCFGRSSSKSDYGDTDLKSKPTSNEALSSIKTRQDCEDRWDSCILRILAKLKILVSTFQISSSIPSALQIGFPKVSSQILNVFSVLSLASLQNIPLNCLESGYNYYSALELTVCIPIIAVLSLATLYFVFKNNTFAKRGKRLTVSVRRQRQLRAKCTLVFFVICYVTLGGVSAQIFGSVSCVNIDPDNTGSAVSRVLTSDVLIDCDSVEYKRGVAFAYVAFAAYVVGIPVMFLHLLNWHRVAIYNRFTAMDDDSREDCVDAPCCLHGPSTPDMLSRTQSLTLHDHSLRSSSDIESQTAASRDRPIFVKEFPLIEGFPPKATSTTLDEFCETWLIDDSSHGSSVSSCYTGDEDEEEEGEEECDGGEMYDFSDECKDAPSLPESPPRNATATDNLYSTVDAAFFSASFADWRRGSAGDPDPNSTSSPARRRDSVIEDRRVAKKLARRFWSGLKWTGVQKLGSEAHRKEDGADVVDPSMSFSDGLHNVRFLFEEYSPRCLFWEALVECPKRIFFMGLLPQMWPGQPGQPLLALAAALAFLKLHSLCRPYQRAGDSVLAEAALVQLLLLLLGALALKTLPSGRAHGGVFLLDLGLSLCCCIVPATCVALGAKAGVRVGVGAVMRWFRSRSRSPNPNPSQPLESAQGMPTVPATSRRRRFSSRLSRMMRLGKFEPDATPSDSRRCRDSPLTLPPTLPRGDGSGGAGDEAKEESVYVRSPRPARMEPAAAVRSHSWLADVGAARPEMSSDNLAFLREDANRNGNGAVRNEEERTLAFDCCFRDGEMSRSDPAWFATAYENNLALTTPPTPVYHDPWGRHQFDSI